MFINHRAREGIVTVSPQGEIMATKSLLSIIVVTIFLASTADAVVLCAKPRSDGTYNTSVKIREACKDNETQLDAAQIGVQGEQGPEGPQGPQGAPGQPNSFVVVDANDVVLGPLVGRSATPAVAPPVIAFREETTGDALALLQYTDETGAVRIRSGRTGGVRFEGLGCTGQAYVSSDGCADPGHQGIDPELIYGPNRNAGATLPERYFAPVALAAQGTMTYSDIDGNGECDDQPLGVPLPCDNSYSATEVTAQFPSPIAAPVRIEPAQ